MKTLIIYDSNYGNTKTIAEAIGKGISKETTVVSVEEYYKGLLENVELIVVGSPINAWRPTEKILQFLGSLTEGELDGIKATAFDTRVDIFFHGDACKKIAKGLSKVGASVVEEPKYFYVNGKEGPLVGGQEEKAKEWGKKLKDIK
jgi:flavodoxin